MFQDSLFATNPRRNPQRGWAAFLSFVVQASFVTVLVALPLFFTEALPIGTSTEVVPLPPVPRGTPPAQPPEIAHQKPTTSNVDQQGRLIAVRVIPRSVAHIVERAAPPPEGAYTSVVGATGDNGDPNGVLQSVLTDGARIAPALKPPPPAKPVRISVMNEGLLIHKVTPEYPSIARIAHQQGTVLLHAIIGRDGTIQQLRAISGPPMLIGAAIQAVQQWRYRPYILNGQSVEVETQITVNFKLGG